MITIKTRTKWQRMKTRTMMKTQKNTKHPLRLVHLGPAFHQDGDNNNNSNNNHKNNDNNR